MGTKNLRHDLGNLLGVALANVEGMIDGIVPTTNERLEVIAESLRRSAALVASLRNDAED
ncbi:MAG: hypothetical protein WBG27_14460 [Candidatus Aquilonibacter sp.]